LLLSTIWKEIPGSPNYEVSENGQVRNAKTGYIMKTYPLNTGYMATSIPIDGKKRNNVLVHTMVARAFLHGPRRPNQTDVAHRDGGKRNNHYTNLRWSSVRENLADAVAHGTFPNALTEEVAEKISHAKGTLREVAAIYGCSQTTVWLLRKGSPSQYKKRSRR
jgi:hypothetical protein